MKKRVTIYDIARELNTTASTVSRALQDHPSISNGMKTAVLELTKKLNYQPNAVASSLRKGKGNTIGVIIPNIDRYFFSSVIRGIEDVAYEAGYNVLICQSHDSWEREKTIVDTLINGRVDGFIVSLALETKNYKHFQLIQDKGIPLIFFDRTPQNMKVHKVEINDFAGAFNAVEHLILQGCKRIAHFSGPQHVGIYKNRFEGYKAALLKNGLEFDEKLVFNNVLTSEEGEETALSISKMKPLPDGIFAASDFSAIGAILKLKQLKINIPQDIAVVGFANEPYDNLLEPGISSVDQHSIEMGRTAAKLLLEATVEAKHTDSPTRIVLNSDLHIRSSSQK